jgi:hypothetical protein
LASAVFQAKKKTVLAKVKKKVARKASGTDKA